METIKLSVESLKELSETQGNESIKEVAQTDADTEKPDNVVNDNVDSINDIVIEISDQGDKEEKCNGDEAKVTLRRKKTSFLETVETIPDNDYKYKDYLHVPKTGTSRRKIEIGSEKMISNDVSNYQHISN